MTTGRTWAPVPEGSPYGLDALPYGVFSTAAEPPRVGVRIGDHVLDVAPLAAAEQPRTGQVFASSTMDQLLALGRPAWAATRRWLVRLLTSPAMEDVAGRHLRHVTEVRMHRPFTVADYVDFYSSQHHAANVGRILRPDGDPLLPNWKHLPVGYHGRSGTVVVSGTDVVRPCGQRKDPGADSPTVGPSRRLDVEAEVGFVVGVPSRMGAPVPASGFEEHVFGVCLVNDWSARDIQAWEYVPLGPFLGKSFATSVSAWVLPLEALQHARVAPPERTHPLVAYLDDSSSPPWGLDITLEVRWNGTVVSRPPFATTYWTGPQQLAHLTVNGASVRTGDLYASGTVSGPDPNQRGSFLELSWGGREPVQLGDGSLRTFLEDGDEVVITATAPGPDGIRVGLGEVAGRILAAR